MTGAAPTSTPGDEAGADERVAVVACDVIEDELRAFAAESDRALDLYFLDIAYHSDYEGMEAAIGRTVERARDAGADRVLLGYGGGCHPHMGRIAKENGAELFPAVNCLHMLAGREVHEEVFADDLLFVTPGWLEKLVPSARADPEKFAVCDRIVYYDPTGTERAANDSSGDPAAERLAELSELTGLPVERREGGRELFDALVRRALE